MDEPARREEIQQQRMRLPSSAPRMRMPTSAPRPRPLLTDEDRRDVAQYEARKATTEEVARAFLQYCLWRTLCPLNRVGEYPPVTVAWWEETYHHSPSSVDSTEEDEPKAKDLFTVKVDNEVAPLVPGETRSHVSWRNQHTGKTYLARDLVRGAPWFSFGSKGQTLWDVIKISPERKWFHAIRELNSDADVLRTVKPPVERKFNFFNEPEEADPSKGKPGLLKEDLPRRNRECRERFRGYLATVDSETLRADVVPALFLVDELSWFDGGFVGNQEADETTNTQRRGTRYPEDVEQDVVFDLSKPNEIIFRCWFTPNPNGEGVPDAFAEALGPNEKPMAEFWRCFFNPLICGFVEEYML
jgi:hypothetical protein